MKTFFTLLLISALLFESILTTIPLVLLLLLIVTSVYKNNWVFVLAFILGILLDLMTLRNIGASSIFFVAVVFLVLLYQSKFEIATNTFIVFASVLASFCFLLMHGTTSNLLLETLLSAIIGFVLYLLTKRVSFVGVKRHD